MKIKVKTLKVIIPLLVIILTAGIVSYSIYDKKRKEKIADIEFRKDIENAIDKEYNSLKNQYDSIVETILDYQYPSQFRIKYLFKLNTLLDMPHRYTKEGGSYNDLYSVEKLLNKNKEEDKDILRSKAQNRVYSYIFGADN